MSNKFMTRKGACAVTTDLDKLATTFETHWNAMGIPEKIAQDFALRCDILSDAIDKQLKRIEASLQAPLDETGLSVEPDGEGFDANAIGDDVGGPQQQETDEAYMTGEFSQQENLELRDRQESGSLPTADPRSAVQLSLQKLSAMQRKSSSFSLRALADGLKACAARLEASKAPGVGSVVGNLKSMYGALDKAADGLLKLDATGEGSPELIVAADRMQQAVSEIMPSLQGLEVAVVDQSSPTALLAYEKMMQEGSIAQLVSLASRLVAEAAKGMGGSKEASAKEEGEGEESEKPEASEEASEDDGKKASTYNIFVA